MKSRQEFMQYKLIEIQIVQSLSFVGNIIVPKLLLCVRIKDMTEQTND